MTNPALRAEVKICGVTRVADARRAVDLGAHYIGLNFWPRSPRYLEPGPAREIVEAVGGRAAIVGVFVDAENSEVEEIDRVVGLDFLQFHGDESPERLAGFGRKAIKVFRIDPDRAAARGDGTAMTSLDSGFDPRLLDQYPTCGGFLFDVRHVDYGGTGRSWNYEWVRGLPTRRPIMVAGGITPQNARQVIDRCVPTVIDVCSGVETTPGVKDEQLMIRLFEEIRNETQIRLA